MTTNRWVRAGALLGAMGGGLRALGSFAPTALASDAARQWLYVAIDACLTAGLLSIYVPRRQRMASAGTLGFSLALLGLIAARTSRAVTSYDIYPVAAGAVAVGVIALSLGEWAAARAAAWIPLAFTLSLVIGGLGTFVAGAGVLLVASGIVFGAAFAGLAVSAAFPRSVTAGSSRLQLRGP